MNISQMLPAQSFTLPAGIYQRTPEWYQQRIGKLTASRMREAMSFLKNGKESAERRKLKFDLVAERLTDVIVNHNVTPAMLWGIEKEAEAKEAAKKFIGIDIVECGFYDSPDVDLWGASPDGLLGDDGLIEIKAPTTPVFLEWMMANKVPEEYKPQMTCQLVVTGRRFCKFLAYDPRVAKRPILYKHYAPSQAERDAVKQAAVLFLAEVDELFERVSTRN